LWSDGGINRLARETGFLKRSPRKLTPKAFLELLLFNVYEQDVVSLTDYAREVEYHQTCRITKQSLHERFNDNAAVFVQKVLSEQLKIRFAPRVSQKAKGFFQGITIQDTTKFSLPEYMKGEYPGYGGATRSDSMASIHFRYELLGGDVEELRVVPGTYSDQKLSADSLGRTNKGHLYLSDLGFFSLDLLDDLRNDAFFISRIKPKMGLYVLKEGRYAKVDLGQIKGELRKGKRECYDFEGFIGSKRKEKVPVRIVITDVPDEVYQERLRKVNKQNRSYGHRTSDEYKLYAQLNVLVTNLSSKHFGYDEIIKLYRLRWQVELVFKTWKSHYKINLVKRVNPCRVKCLMYASLLLAVINWGVFGWLTRRSLADGRGWLSMDKFTKMMKLLREEQRRWLRSIGRNTKGFIGTLCGMQPDLIHLEKRKNRYNFIDIISIII